jgi:hypothetical protein
MNTYTDKHKTIVTAEAIEANRRVKLNASQLLVYADAGEDAVGYSTHYAANGDVLTVKLLNDSGTMLLTSSAAIAAGASVYGANDGKIDDTASGDAVGTALEAASGANVLIEVIQEGANDNSLLEGVTAGTVTASKAVVVDANKDIASFNDVTVAELISTDLTATTVVLASATKQLTSSGVTPTELDFLDGATAGTQVASKAVVADANINTGVVKATELHIGATGAEAQVTATPAELNLLDTATAGTQVASVAVIADANVNIGATKVTELHIGATGAETQVTATAAELNLLDTATAGTQVASIAVIADANVNIGATKVTELHIGATGAETQVTATAAELNYLDLTGAVGTQEASKAVVADANVNTGVSKVTELHIGATGAETQVTATAAELNLVDGFVAPAAKGVSIKKLVSIPFLYSDQSGSGAFDTAVTIPDNCIVTRVWYDVVATFGGDGDDSSTLAISVEGANDIVSALAINDGTNIWDAGLHDAIPQGDDPSTFVKTSAARNVTVTVAINATDAALDQGSMMIFMEYVQSI